MIELLVGHYNHGFSHSMDAKWRPGRGRPLWASAVYQASVVRWRSHSIEAVRQKAKHFRTIVANAARQLPPDRPGVVHVGVETWSGGDVDGLRHFRNKLGMMLFEPGATRLRWVYGEYSRLKLACDRMRAGRSKKRRHHTASASIAHQSHYQTTCF